MTTTELNEKRTAIEEKIKSYNEAILSNKTIDEVGKIEAAIKADVAEYNKDSKLLVYAEIKATEKPMLEAVKRYYYPTIKTIYKKIEDSTLKIMVLEDNEKVIDLLDYCNVTNSDKNWYYAIEKFNMLYAIRICGSLNPDVVKKINDSFFISKTAKSIELGKNPVSNGNIIKTLTSIVQNIIGEEYSPINYDIKALDIWYGVRDNKKKYTTKCSTPKVMMGHIFTICSRIVENGKYDTTFKFAPSKSK